MGDPVTGVAPLEYVKVFFEQERLPYNEGWRPTAAETNLNTLGAMVLALNLANGEVVPEGLLLTTNTVKVWPPSESLWVPVVNTFLQQAFGGYDPITGLLAKALGRRGHGTMFHA